MQLAARQARLVFDPCPNFRGASFAPVAVRALMVFGLFVCLALAALRAAPGRNAQAPGAASAHRIALIPQSAAIKAKRVDTALDDDSSDDAAATTWARRIPDEEFRRQIEALEEAKDGTLKFGPMHVRRDLVETVVRAAQQTAFDPAVLMAIADKESSFSAGVKAQTSSASGLFQFIDTTWLRVVRQFGASHGLEREAAEVEGPDDRPAIADPQERERVLAIRNQPYLAAVMAAEMLKFDGGQVAKVVGRSLTAGETYLTHFLGTKDANRFLSSYDEEPKSSAAQLLKRPARANRPIFFAHTRGGAKALSVANVHDKFEEMMGTRVDRYAGVGDIAGAMAYSD